MSAINATPSNQTPAKSTDPGLGGPLPQAADPIDRVVRLAPKWTIFVLAACAILIVGALAWSFAGQITSTVTAPGILKDAGHESVLTTDPGEVLSVEVSVGDSVKKGDVLIRMAPGDPIVAPKDGVVAAIYVASGYLVKAGSVAAAVTDPDMPDIVYAKLASSQMARELADLPVRMDVAIAPATRYGYLLGRVLEVSAMPMTTAQIAASLGVAEEIVIQALGEEPGLLAIIGVTPDPNTPSHHSWTVGSGPSFLLNQGTPVSAQIIVSEQAPILVVFPGLAGE